VGLPNETQQVFSACARVSQRWSYVSWQVHRTSMSLTPTTHRQPQRHSTSSRSWQCEEAASSWTGARTIGVAPGAESADCRDTVDAVTAARRQPPTAYPQPTPPTTCPGTVLTSMQVISKYSRSVAEWSSMSSFEPRLISQNRTTWLSDSIFELELRKNGCMYSALPQTLLPELTALPKTSVAELMEGRKATLGSGVEPPPPL